MDYKDYLRLISKTEGREQALKECEEIRVLLEKTVAKDIPGMVHDSLNGAWEAMGVACKVFTQAEKMREKFAEEKEKKA